MAIFKEGDRFLKWKYRVSEIYLLFPNEEPVQLPTERLVSMSIMHDYENNFFPLFRIELVLESDRYYKILQNKETMQFKLRIQKYYREIGKKKESILRDFINDTFDLILDDDDYDLDSGFKEEQAGSDYSKLKKENNNDLFSADNRIEFFLFKSNTIRASKKIVNRILYNASVTDAISYIMSSTGIRNVLMAPADNQDTIQELVIPPLHALGALTFVDCYYGIYKSGSVLYFDLDRNYIFPYDGKCRCWEKNEIKQTSILIPKKNSTFSSDMCTVDKSDSNTKTNYLVGNNSTISIKNNSVTYDILAGNDIESINLYSGDVSQGDSKTITKSENNERVLPNRTENPYFNEIYMQQSTARSIVIQTNFGDYDVGYLKPNIIYNFIFEDTKLTIKYKGSYRMVRCTHMFVRDGRDFAISSDVMFKCMSPTIKKKG